MRTLLCSLLLLTACSRHRSELAQDEEPPTPVEKPVEVAQATRDMEVVCTANLQGQQLAEFLAANIKSKDVVSDLSALTSVAPAERSRLIRVLAKENGYDGPCPMADLTAAL